MINPMAATPSYNATVTLPILEYRAGGEQNVRPLFGTLEKCCVIALGVVLPMICFVAAAHEYLPEPGWQTGDWNRYILFVPDGRAGFPFYPLLAYSMIALCIFVARPQLSRLLAVRFGLYSGIFLALQYTLIQATCFHDGFIVALLVGLATNFVLLGIMKLLERIPRRIIRYLGVSTAVMIALVVMLTGVGGRAIYPLADSIEHFGMGTGLVCLVFAPAWCVGAYTRAVVLAMRFRREQDEVRSRMPITFAWVAWLAPYVIAWKWSITNAIALYAALPSNPPNCYIATAAASGHRRFVGSSAVRAPDGSIYQVNLQLRRLKCVEIVLAAVWPKGHRRIRQIYDLIGPPLARSIARQALLADIAFVTLKPIEWFMFGLLICLAPDVRGVICDVYSEKRPNCVVNLPLGRFQAASS